MNAADRGSSWQTGASAPPSTPLPPPPQAAASAAITSNHLEAMARHPTAETAWRRMMLVMRPVWLAILGVAVACGGGGGGDGDGGSADASTIDGPPGLEIDAELPTSITRTGRVASYDPGMPPNMQP